MDRRVLYFGYFVGYAISKDSKLTVITNEEWEILFCTKIEKLRNYANKMATYYENRYAEKRLK